MRTTFVAALLALVGMASADSLETMIFKGIANVMQNVEKKPETKPEVKNWGFYWNPWTEAGFGIDLGVTVDLSAGYAAPWYTENQYAVTAPHAHMLLGGEQYLTIGLGIMKLTFFFEANGIHYIPATYKAKINVLEYNQFCHQMDWSAKIGEFVFKFQFDIDECAFGLGGLFIGQPFDCTWQNYYVNYPLYRYQAPNLVWGGSYFQNTCIGGS